MLTTTYLRGRGLRLAYQIQYNAQGYAILFNGQHRKQAWCNRMLSAKGRSEVELARAQVSLAKRDIECLSGMKE